MAIDPIITESYFKPITNAATGRVAFEVRGPGGIVAVECGDTGLRDVTGLVAPNKIIAGKILVRRKGSAVTWHFVGVQVPAAVTHPWELVPNNNIPLSKFAPEFNINHGVMANANDTARILLDASGGIAIHYAEPSNTYTAAITFVTGRSWPDALPGVVNGQPVGV